MIDIQRHRWFGLIPACVLLIACVAFTLSFCAERANSVQGAILILLLLPLLWLVAVPTVRINDGLVERWFLLALGLVVWMAGVQALHPGTLPCGWYRFAERGMAITTCLFVVVSRPDPMAMIRTLGASAACVVCVGVIVNGYCGFLVPLGTDCFGFGHINILANTAGPSLIAWLAFTTTRTVHGVRTKTGDAILLGLGLLGMAIIAVTTQRRGLVLGMGAAAAWLGFLWLWSRHRRAALLVLALALVMGMVLAWKMFLHTAPSLRNERIIMYRAAIDGIKEVFPWGFGHYGALHLQWSDGEAARHMTATGGWGTHIHNEFLDETLDGGPVALLLLLGLIGIIIYRVCHIRDIQVRIAYQAMGAAVIAHLMTDNVYGTEMGEMWAAVVAGMMLSTPVTGPAMRSLNLVPTVRWLAWPLTLLSVWGATHLIYPAVIHKDAEAEIHFRCLEKALDPQTIDLHARSLLNDSEPAINSDARQAVIDEAVHKMGWTGNMAICAVRSALEKHDTLMATDDALRVLRFSPFYKDAYAQLAEILQRYPGNLTRVPGPIQRRLAYLRGDPHLPVPDLSSGPETIEDAIDTYCAIIWEISVDKPWSQINDPLYRLCKRYGDVPWVSILVVQAASTAPEGTFPWLSGLTETVRAGLRSGNGVQPILAGIRTAAQASAVYPLIARLYADIIAECDGGRMSFDPKSSPLGIAVRNEVVRIWGLKRAGARQTAPVD